jgi:hypothetical protein
VNLTYWHITHYQTIITFPITLSHAWYSYHSLKTNNFDLNNIGGETKSPGPMLIAGFLTPGQWFEN